MEHINEIVETLNVALNDPDFNVEDIKKILNNVIKLEKYKVELIDFEFFNEECLNYTEFQKLEALKYDNYELASSWRDRYKIVLEFIELKKKLNIEKSMFFREKNFFLYFYLGTEKNDKQLKEIYNEFSKNKMRR